MYPVLKRLHTAEVISISKQLYRLAEPLRKTEYGQYLLRVPEEK